MGTTVPNNLGPRQQWLDTSPFHPVPSSVHGCLQVWAGKVWLSRSPEVQICLNKGKKERQLCIVPQSLYPYQLTFYFKFLVHFQ